MVKNKYVRFGRHVEIHVIYKILWLEVPKKVSILRNPPCFKRGYFEVALDTR
jgi:hypothetical protein